MLADQFVQFLAADTILDEVDLHHVHIAEIVKVVVLVPNVGNTSRHAGGKVAPSLTEDDDSSSRHILTAVVTGSFEDGNGSRVTHTETLAHLTIDVELSGSGTIQSCVTCDDVLFSDEISTGRGEDGDTPATESLGEIVICLAFQFEGHAMGEESTERLSRRTFELHVDGTVGKSLFPVFLDDSS